MKREDIIETIETIKHYIEKNVFCEAYAMCVTLSNVYNNAVK